MLIYKEDFYCGDVVKKKEIILFSIVLLVAIGVVLSMSYINRDAKKTAVVTIDGEDYKTIPISDETNMEFTIETDHGYNNVVVTDGVVDVISADCPNQVCVNTKAAHQVNDLIVCLPHKVVIEIVEDE